jgi:3'-phosphoadenosine 5'-phosphosulfate sulfotransferase (PAPS reductase)/FAD synthetase
MASIQEALASVGDPNVRHIVSISGGKDSAALAIHMRQRYPEIPTEYVFCDTHCELPETEDYLNQLEALLGVEIQRRDAFNVLDIKRKNRNPFEFYLNELYGGFLPSPRTRWCTRALKIEVFEEFVGNTHAFSYIGIRGDEDREGYRWRKPPAISERPNIIPVYPFKDDGLGLDDVFRILEDSGIGLPDYYRWRSRSGCYFCFYQQIAEWQGLKEEHPDLFEDAKRFEKVEGDKRYTWVDGRTLDEIAALPRHKLKSAADGEGCAICHL